MFSKNGGPGNFALCHGGKPCATPGGGLSYNWRVSVVAGPNKFGGTMNMLGVQKLVAKFHQQGANLSINNNLFFGFTPKWKGNSGQVRHSAGSASSTFLSYTMALSLVSKAQSGSGPPCNYTTMGTHTPGSFGTLCPGGMPVLSHLPGSASISYYGSAGTGAQGTGFPWTTGTVKVSATQVRGRFDYLLVSLAGYDNRTALGKGNIQLVSPIVIVQTPRRDSFLQIIRLRMRIGQDAPVPALSPGGFLVASVLMLLLTVGFVVRRRL